MPDPPRVICIVGPTGTGKSTASLYLAEKLGGEIVNADSRQVYADFPVITAQPDSEDRARCPHHLYAFLRTEQKISVGKWLESAHAALAKARETPLLFTGGTGLYVRALTRGLARIPPVDEALARELEREYPCSDALHARLRDVDPAYAARTHAHNRRRALRALAVWKGTGRPFSWWHELEGARPRCRALCIGLRAELAVLEPRLKRRIAAMLDAGALDEARRAKERCDDGRAPGWSGIGCAQLYRHLNGELSLEEARVLWHAATRAYAKRQLTWFRAQPDIVWMEPDDLPGMLNAARAFLERSGAE
jgi:tRNA dimethylallyltransferase